MLNFDCSIKAYVYNIEHLEGSPHGPCFSSVSSFVLDFSVVIFFAPLFCSFVRAAAVPLPLAVWGPSSQAKLTLETALPKLSPWIVATSSSKGEG